MYIDANCFQRDPPGRSVANPGPTRAHFTREKRSVNRELLLINQIKAGDLCLAAGRGRGPASKGVGQGVVAGDLAVVAGVLVVVVVVVLLVAGGGVSLVAAGAAAGAAPHLGEGARHGAGHGSKHLGHLRLGAARHALQLKKREIQEMRWGKGHRDARS